LPVHVYTGGDTQILRADLSRREHRFSWFVPGIVDSVVVDPDGWALFRQAGTPPPPLQFFSLEPNPAGIGGTTLRFLMRTTSSVTCSLYDVRGRRLGRWDLGVRPATETEPAHWTWDGRDGSGRPVPAGVYWFELKAGAARAVQKLTMVR